MSDARRTQHLSLRQTKRSGFLASVKAALEELQPGLEVIESQPQIIISGTYTLAGPEGPFDEFKVRLVVDYEYPNLEAKLFETGGRIPQTADRHINKDGDCCVAVWEEWLASARNTSFRNFITGPVHEFFLSQWWFEQTGEWRFGQRAHGLKGLIDGYAQVLGVQPQRKPLFAYLRILMKAWPKGHYLCPCGSGSKIRSCHAEALSDLHQRVPPKLAARMMRRLRRYLGLRVRQRRGGTRIS